MGTKILHGDFTFDDEKVEEIAKNIEVVNRNKAVLGQFFSPNAAIVGDRLTKRRQVLLDPESVANLNEGQTPRKDKIKVLTWSQATRSYGSYIEYSRQAYKKNRDSIVDMARRQLTHNRVFDIEATRFAALNGVTNTIDAVYGGSPAKFDWWKTFSNVKVAARKNKCSGKPVFMATPEIMATIMEEVKTTSPNLMAGSPAAPDFVKSGYIGEYNGIVLVENAESYMYPAYEAYTAASYPSTGTDEQKAAHATAVAAYNAAYGTHYGATDDLPAVTAGVKQLGFFICHSEDGELPFKENGLNEGNIEVISKEIGSAGTADPTNEVGTIAARIDDVGAYCEHPEAVFKVNNILATMVSKVDSALPDAYLLGSAFEEVGSPAHEYGQGRGKHDATGYTVSPSE